MYLNLDIFKIKTNKVEPKKGRILIAEPFLSGSYFNRSIIYLVEHSEKGSVGFILNKPVDFPVKEFVSEFPRFSKPIYLGGPVNIESLYYLHTLGEHIPGSIHIVDNIYWGGDYEHLRDLIQSGFATKENVRFFLGYSGWDNDQLKEELKDDSWLVSDIEPNRILRQSDNLWSDMVKAQGNAYSLWENFPENPSLN